MSFRILFFLLVFLLYLVNILYCQKLSNINTNCQDTIHFEQPMHSDCSFALCSVINHTSSHLYGITNSRSLYKLNMSNGLIEKKITLPHLTYHKRLLVGNLGIAIIFSSYSTNLFYINIYNHNLEVIYSNKFFDKQNTLYRNPTNFRYFALINNVSCVVTMK